MTNSQGYLKVSENEKNRLILGKGNSPDDLTGASVQMFVKDRITDETIVNGRDVKIVDAENGVIEVDWTPDDTEQRRKLLAEFKAEYSDVTRKYPKPGFYPVKISETLEEEGGS